MAENQTEILGTEIAPPADGRDFESVVPYIPEPDSMPNVKGDKLDDHIDDHDGFDDDLDEPPVVGTRDDVLKALKETKKVKEIAEEQERVNKSLELLLENFNKEQRGRFLPDISGVRSRLFIYERNDISKFRKFDDFLKKLAEFIRVDGVINQGLVGKVVSVVKEKYKLVINQGSSAFIDEILDNLGIVKKKK